MWSLQVCVQIKYARQHPILKCQWKPKWQKKIQTARFYFLPYNENHTVWGTYKTIFWFSSWSASKHTLETGLKKRSLKMFLTKTTPGFAAVQWSFYHLWNITYHLILHNLIKHARQRGSLFLQLHYLPLLRQHQLGNGPFELQHQLQYISDTLELKLI